MLIINANTDTFDDRIPESLKWCHNEWLCKGDLISNRSYSVEWDKLDRQWYLWACVGTLPKASHDVKTKTMFSETFLMTEKLFIHYSSFLHCWHSLHCNTPADTHRSWQDHQLKDFITHCESVQLKDDTITQIACINKLTLTFILASLSQYLDWKKE